MKFAKELEERLREHPAWAASVPPYKQIKKLLSQAPPPSDALPGGDKSSEVTRAIGKLLQTTLIAANEYVESARAAYLDEVERERVARAAVEELLSAAEQDADALNAARNEVTTAEHDRWLIGRDARDFAELCYRAFYKTVKKHDKVLKSSLTKPLLSVVELQPFMTAAAGGLIASTEFRLSESSDGDDRRALRAAHSSSILTVDDVIARFISQRDSGEAADAAPASSLNHLVLVPSYSELVDVLGDDSGEDTPSVGGGGAQAAAPVPFTTTTRSPSRTTLSDKPELEVIIEGESAVSVPHTLNDSDAVGIDALMNSTIATDESNTEEQPRTELYVRAPLSTPFEQQSVLPSFMVSLKTVRCFTRAAIRAAAPEIAAEDDGAALLSPLETAIADARANISVAQAGAARDSALLIEKVRIFSVAASAVTQTIARVTPEHAASLEILMAAHHALFFEDAGLSPPPPSEHLSLLSSSMPLSFGKRSILRQKSSTALRQKSVAKGSPTPRSRRDFNSGTGGGADSEFGSDGGTGGSSSAGRSRRQVISNHQTSDAETRMLSVLGPGWAEMAQTPSISTPVIARTMSQMKLHRSPSFSSQTPTTAPRPPTPAPEPRVSAVRYSLNALISMVDDAGVASAAQPKTAKEVVHLLFSRIKPPIFDWLPEYKWRKHLRTDVTAGLTIGVLLIPQGLACATLAGVPAAHGLWAGFPAAAYALFGSSKHAAIGPMSIPSLLVAAGVLSILNSRTASGADVGADDAVRLMLTITLLVGFFLAVLGLLRLGFVVRFISQPVLSGFTAASATLTMLSTVRDLTGARIATTSAVVQDLLPAIFRGLGGSHGLTVATSFSAFVVLWVLATKRCARISRVTPPPLFIVAASIVIFASVMSASHDSGSGGATATGVRLVGSISSAFPSVWWPWTAITVDDFRDCLLPALSVALVGLVESVAVAKMYALRHGYEVSANAELLALGVTNSVGAIFMRSLPTMAAFGRSAVNDNAGARSQVSGLVSSATVALLLSFIAPALFYLPRPVLAAVICVAVAGLIDIRGAISLWYADRVDFAVFIAASITTMTLGVTLGFGVAMGLSLVCFLALTTRPRVEELGRLKDTVVYRHLGLVGVIPSPRNVKILRFLAPLFFANVGVLRERIAREISRREDAPPRYKWTALIVCFSSISSVDSTAIAVLKECASELRARGALLVIAAANFWVEEAFTAAGFTTFLASLTADGTTPIYRRVHDAVRAVLLGRALLATPPHQDASPISVTDINEIRATGLVASLWASLSSFFLSHRQELSETPQNAGVNPTESSSVSAGTVLKRGDAVAQAAASDAEDENSPLDASS